jgi:hypothetical protein
LIDLTNSDGKLLESEVMESGFQDTKIADKDYTDAIVEGPNESISAWEEAAIAAKELHAQ